MSVSYGGDSITFADGSVQSGAWNGFRNRIINGCGIIDQRNAGASYSVPTTNPAYSVDRWAVYATNASKYTVQQSTEAPAGYPGSIKFTSSAATTVNSTDYYCFRQTIEGYNIADLNLGTVNAKTCTLSFWVRSSVTGVFGAAAGEGTGKWYPFTYTINTADTWEYKTIVITGDTNNLGTYSKTNGTGMFIQWQLGIGSTYIGGSSTWTASTYLAGAGTNSSGIIATNGATFYITGVQLERGSTASSFEYRPYGTELALCQRYFEKTYLQSEVPGANYDARDSACRTYSFGDSSAQSQPFVWNFKVSKRIAPTLNIYNPYNGTANQYRVVETGTNMSAQVIKNTSTETCTVASSGAGLSSNYRFDVHLTAASEL